MQTSPVMNTIAPAQTQAAKPNDTNASPDSANSFGQVLSREIADRKSTAEPQKAREPEAKAGAKASAPEKAQNAKAANDTDSSSADVDSASDTQDDAVTATNDMLALVASLNQANPAAQAAQAAQGTQQAASDAAEAATQGLSTAVDAVGAKGKTAIETGAASTARKADAIDPAAGAAAKAKAIVEEKVAVSSGQARPAQTDTKADTAPNFSHAFDKAAKSADDSAAQDARTMDANSTAQAKPVQELGAKAKEAAPVAAARAEHALESKEQVVAPASVQVQPQVAVNNLTHLASAQPSDVLAPRVGTPAWDQALGQKVTWMVAGEQQSASLTLNPPDLGPLQVVLNVTNSQANATFVAAQPEVRQALEAAMPRLRDMLSDAGIQLGQATVSSGSPGQQGGFDQQQSSSNGRRADVSTVRFDTPVQTGRAQVATSGQGLVDTFV